MKAKMVDKLENVGKTYTIYVKGHKLINLTLERGKELNAEIALDIVKDIAKQQEINPDRIKPEDVTFEEIKPEYNFDKNELEEEKRKKEEAKEKAKKAKEELEKVMEDLYFHEKWRKEGIEYLNKQRIEYLNKHCYFIEEEERQLGKFGICLSLLLLFGALIGWSLVTCA